MFISKFTNHVIAAMCPHYEIPGIFKQGNPFSGLRGEKEIKSILCRKWVFGPCYVNDLAFRTAKVHVPFMTPAFKVVKIFLEYL